MNEFTTETKDLVHKSIDKIEAASAEIKQEAKKVEGVFVQVDEKETPVAHTSN